MTKYIPLLLLAFLLLSSCAGPDAEPVSLTGSWETTNPDTVDMRAVVSDGMIEILWVDGDTNALYWLGTVPVNVMSGDTFTSEGDTDAMRKSLLGSLSETKEITYADGTLSLDLTAMGVTQTLYFERV